MGTSSKNLYTLNNFFPDKLEEYREMSYEIETFYSCNLEVKKEEIDINNEQDEILSYILFRRYKNKKGKARVISH